MQKLRRSWCALAVVMSGASIPAIDLIVDPGNPLAYPSLQAALNAALPGDRILLAVPLYVSGIVVQKSVTIEPLGPGRQTIWLTAAGGSLGELRIEALSPGLPLTLRRLDVYINEWAGAPLGIYTAGAVPGEIRFDQVQMYRDYFFGSTVYGGGALANLNTSIVWMRETSLTVADLRGSNGCIDLYGNQGRGWRDPMFALRNAARMFSLRDQWQPF